MEWYFVVLGGFSCEDVLGEMPGMYIAELQIFCWISSQQLSGHVEEGRGEEGKSAFGGGWTSAKRHLWRESQLKPTPTASRTTKLMGRLHMPQLTRIDFSLNTTTAIY